ncbi:hypothetical protein PhCBS80983_g02658 [Powellomyces hirtus]|uniref:Uncharacterized protein n=1 Tax=Powellomyces hirtus TaxID=109895 RepID=A0A507E781_9FUNG|nr:hypothetical protein PhCBS80983_g02658 [Powellomyces hirtus]
MQQVYDFYSIGPADEALRYLVSILNNGKEDPQRTLILMDFYFYTLRFAKSTNLSPEQASVFFSIMKTTHERTAASPFLHLEKDYEVFKDTLLRHSVHRPPFSQKIFSLAEAKAIDEYAVNTYFRHYLMYKYAFTKKLRLNLSIDNDTPDVAHIAIPPVPVLGADKGEGAATPTTEDVVEKETPVDEASVQPPEQTIEKAEGSQDAPVRESAVPPTNEAPQPEKEEPQPTIPHADSGEHVQKETQQATAEDSISEVPRPTIQEIAAKELAAFVTQTLQSKMDELRKSLMTKLQVQEDQMAGKLKRLEEKDGGGDEKLASAKGKDAKGKKK